MGNVMSANLGQAPARRAALGAGLPASCVCTTVNKVCSSGLKSVTLAAQDIMLGFAEIAVAGGMESMSRVPYYIPGARFGCRRGNSQLIDGVANDGLIDPYKQKHVGTCAESCAKSYCISRERQDTHARESYRRAIAAWSEGKFDQEVVPVATTVHRKELIVDRDEECFQIDPTTIDAMRPCFADGAIGTVTKGNSCGLNDGAAAVVLTSRSKAAQLDLPILGIIRGFADSEQEPENFTTSPSLSIPKALKRAGFAIDEVDVFELNEPFSVVALAICQILRLPEDKVNIHGGAVSLGHPLGSSGARILVTLLNVMQQQSGRVGVAGICNGGGGSTAIVVEQQQVVKR